MSALNDEATHRILQQYLVKGKEILPNEYSRGIVRLFTVCCCGIFDVRSCGDVLKLLFVNRCFEEAMPIVFEMIACYPSAFSSTIPLIGKTSES